MIWAVRGLILGALILVGGLALVSAQKVEPVPVTAVPEATPIPTLGLPALGLLALLVSALGFRARARRR